MMQRKLGGSPGAGRLLWLALAAAPMTWAQNDVQEPAPTEEAAREGEDGQRSQGDKRGNGSDTDSALDVETILNNPLGDEAYRERRTCVNTRSIDRVEILNDSMVLFHVRRKKAWLNKLSSRCLGLQRDMIVNLRVFGGSVCRLDTFRGLSRLEMFPAAHCRLGDFEAIEGAQIEALKTALAEERQAADIARKQRRAERRERRRAERGS